MLGFDDTNHANQTESVAEEGTAVDLDEECSPTRVCRNARDFSFDGFADEGGDLQAAWRDTLAREGKLGGTADSIRNLVLGCQPSS
jgi:hypothetical protein